MRYLLAILCVFVPMMTFAISCPNNGSLIDNASLDQALKKCGQPTSRKDYTKSLSETWTYYIPDSTTQRNAKVIILFNSGVIANIGVTDVDSQGIEKNVVTCNLCNAPISVGNNFTYVQSACGDPSQKKSSQENIEQVTELTYGDSLSPNTLVFVNRNLVDWK